MTPGQIAKLQELARCYMPRSRKAWVYIWLDPFWTDKDGDKMDKSQRAVLRRLWHQYMPQIIAMRRNRNKTAPV
jgi:hypothetical protein